MTRTEMICDIASDLILHDLDQPSLRQGRSVMSYKVAQELAEIALTVAEGNGMLPPSHYCCILTGLPKERGEVLMYNWEPEEVEE